MTATISGTTADAPRRPIAAYGSVEALREALEVFSEHFQVHCAYVSNQFKGFVYEALARPIVEPDPAQTFMLLSALADERAAALPDYPDEPEAAERRARLTEALYLMQAESMTRYDD